MPVLWPDGGPWALATTSAGVDWQPAAAALAAASTVRVAALVFGAGERPGELLLGELATFLQAAEGSADPLSVDEAVALVRTLARTHGLVLMVGVPGLLVPVGRAGWTLMDLAVAVSAPVVMVTGTGPDSANHTSLALGAVSGHGLAGTVITVDTPAPPGAPGAPDHERAPDHEQAEDRERAMADRERAQDHEEAPDHERAGDHEQAVADHEVGMPVVPAGRIPGDVGVHGDSLAAAARDWLHPLLHASAGRPKADTPPPPPQPLPPPATAGGKRVVLLLAGVFVSMSLVVCGLAFCDRSGSARTEIVNLEATFVPRPPDVHPGTVLGGGDDGGTDTDTDQGPTRAVGDVCPQNRRGVTTTVPDQVTTKRVNAAWKRIEVWLAAHAPASRRSLRPPAPAKEIAAAQRRMSVAFPADLVASLRRHDGVVDRGAGFSLPFFYSPMPVAEIAPEWLMLCSALVDVFGEDDSAWWDKSFVPFASSGDGGNLLVDQRPGSHGRVGEFYNEDGVSFERWPGSVAELLEKTAQSLESGRPYDNRYRPKVTKGGVLEWDVI